MQTPNFNNNQSVDFEYDMGQSFEDGYIMEAAVRQYEEENPCLGNAQLEHANHGVGSFSFTSPTPETETTCPKSLGTVFFSPHYPPQPHARASQHADNLYSTEQIRMTTGLASDLQNTKACEERPNLNEHGQFQFQSRALVIQDRSKSNKKPGRSEDPDALRCTIEGCKSKRTFKRKYELQRHMRKHTSQDRYRCIVKSCGEEYYRLDKVQRHLMTAHSAFDDCGCACDGFSSISIPLAFMTIHASDMRHELVFKTSYSIVKPLKYQRSCLVSSCKSTVHIKDMREHLSAHSSPERQNAAQQIREAGYDPKTLDIICPVCQHPTSMLSGFADHIESSHLVTDLEYFKSLKEVCKYLSWLTNELWRQEPLSPFEFKMVQETIRNHNLQIEWTSAYHHVRYLKHYEKLRPHRAVILFHWPEFRNHPIFDDIHHYY